MLKLLRNAAFVAFVAFAGTETAAQDRTPESDREAYQLSLRCMVANVVSADISRRGGDEAAALRYEASSETAFNAAVSLGRMVGLSGATVERDMNAAIDRELPKMNFDQSYFNETVGRCRRAGLVARA